MIWQDLGLCQMLRYFSRQYDILDAHHSQSRRRESNPQPAVYKTAALPLSYVGS